MKYLFLVFVFALVPLFSGPVFGQNSSDDIIHGRCLDGHDFWRQGIVDITKIGKDGQVFVNQESHIVSSVLHKNNQSETIHLRLQITSPHPDSKLDQTKQIVFDKCDSVALVYWTFTPMVPGKHKIELREQEGGSGYSSSFIVKDPDGKSLKDYIPAPLKQYESGINPSKIVCEVPLQMVLRMDGTPACVKQATMVKLWDQGWVKPAGEYIKFSSKQLRDEFHSKIMSKEDAIKISQDYLRDNKLSLNLNMNDPKATISATLFYAQLADGQQAEVDVKPDTGLPVEPMPPWSEKFYRNPQWWSELQKDYLSMENHRIEQGNLVWGVTYGEQPDCICIGNYAEFLVDAITGKIIRVPPPELLSALKHANADPDSLIPANSWNDYDKFAQDLVNVTHDTIIEKRSDDANQALYTTQKGNLIIRKNNLDDYSVMVDYSTDKTKIPKSDADSFVDSFMENINYQMDGTEKIDRTDYGTHYRIAISQKNHGWIIQNQMMQFEFWRDNPTVYIRLGKWYNNLSQIELKTSQDEAKKIAFDYLTSEIKKDSKLVGQQTIDKPQWVQMEVVNDRLVYVVAGSGFPLNVLVDPVSGGVVGLKQPMRMD